jgi:hypothetical protein
MRCRSKIAQAERSVARDRNRSEWLRAFLFAIIGVLLINSYCPLTTCLIDHAPSHSPLEASTDGTSVPDDDADCCSFCACCHFTAVISSVDFVDGLTADKFIYAVVPPVARPSATGPLDQPPRA